MCYVHQYDEFHRSAFFRVIRIITLDCQLHHNKKKSGKIREFSWLGVVRVRIFWVGVILGRNFLWWKFSGWELSRGNHPGGSFHVTLLNIVLCCKIYLMSMNLSKNYSFFLNILKTY